MVMNILTEGKRFSTCKAPRRDVPLVVDLAVLHPTSKGEGASCPSNDTQDTTALLEDVRRTVDNTSVPVLKMLVLLSIEAHV